MLAQRFGAILLPFGESIYKKQITIDIAERGGRSLGERAGQIISADTRGKGHLENADRSLQDLVDPFVISSVF